MQETKISIIVQVQNNAGSCLRRCLDSLVNQTFRDLEIVCINENSSDVVSDILKAYAELDGRIVIEDNLETKGTLRTRRDAVLFAKGDYIIFVDGTYFLELDACEHLYNIIRSMNVDIIHFEANTRSTSRRPDIGEVSRFIPPHDGALIHEDILMHCFSYEEHGHTFWNKMFSASLCKKAFTLVEGYTPDTSSELYVYFLILYFAKSYAGVKARAYYMHCADGVNELCLERFVTLCYQSNALQMIANFLQREGATDKYKVIYSKITNYAISSCLWYWYYLLSPGDSAKGFDVLLDNFDNDNLIYLLVEKYSGNQCALARKLHLARNLTLHKKALHIRTIGVFYYRMRYGGVERVLSILIQIWLRIGYSVVLFTDEPSSKEDFLSPELVKRVVLPASIGVSSFDYTARAMALRQAIRESHVDIFIHHAGSSDLLVNDILCVKTLGVPVIVSSHEVFTAQFNWLGDADLMRGYAYRIADMVTVLSRIEQKIFGKLGINSVYVPNPPSFELSTLQIADKAGKNILWVGRLSEEKQYLDAVRILSRVVRAIPDAKLFLVGKAETPRQVERLKDEIAKMQMEDNVIVCGYCGDMGAVYEIASVYLMTSYVESFSMTLFESKAYGLPCVMYALPYLELVGDGLGFVAVEQGDEGGAARAIVELLNDKKYREAKGFEARLSAETFCHSFDVGKKWQDIFSSNEAGEVRNNNTKCYDEDFKLIIDRTLFHYKNGLAHFKNVLSSIRLEKNTEKDPVAAERDRLLSERQSLIAETVRLNSENTTLNARNEETQIMLDVGLLSKLPSFSLKRIAEFLSTLGRALRNPGIERLGLRLFQYIDLINRVQTRNQKRR
jgi:glycosyltransferase involved in cell wall biosynthesis